jgi:hypothetical protein
MPTTYTWTVTSGSGTGSSAGSPGTSIDAYGTGADGRTPYAFSRQMDAMTGDAVFDEDRRSWALGAPLAERVLRCLRTTKGTAGRDPSYGMDWSTVDNARTNAAVAAKQAIKNALQRFVDRGVLAQLVVETDVVNTSDGKAFLFKVSFRDPLGSKFSITGRPS